MIRAGIFFMLSGGAAIACDAPGIRLAADTDGAPQVFALLDQVQLAQPFSVQLHVCPPQTIAGINVDAVMPAHQHGMNYVPVLTDAGGGAYEVDGLVFHMSGTWELRVDIDFPEGSVLYTHAVTLR